VKSYQVRKSFRQHRARGLLAYTQKDENGCLIYLGVASGSGVNIYPQCSINNKTWYVHRYIAFSELEDHEFIAIAFDKDIVVMHNCDNSLCINPEHLTIGTRSQNLLDAYARGRRNHEGVNNPRAKLSEEDVIVIRRLYKEGNLNQSEIARLLGVAISTVNHACLGYNWSKI